MAVRPGKITRYEIRDATGNLIALHIRTDLAEGKKMRWELPDGTTNLGGIKTSDLPLYGVEHLRAAPTEDPVVVCEGEKAMDALRSNGVLAVGTVTGASGAPGDETLRPLLGRLVFLWPDNDTPGREHMAQIGASLLRIGHRNLRQIDWKGAPDKGDAADLFALEGARDEIDALLTDAKKFTGTAQETLAPQPERAMFEPIESLLANSAPQQWLIKGRLEIPSTVLCFGESGAGKSFVEADMAANVASGGHWAGAKVSTEGTVFYIAGEGRHGLIRRFAAWQHAHGRTIPPGRLFISTRRIELSDTGALTVEEEIERMAVANGTPKLVVVDTLSRALPPDADENHAGDTNAFVNVVDRLRDRFGCVVVIVHHCGHEKGRARGSSALKAGMDAEFCVLMRSGVRSLEWTKMKDSETPPPIEFVLDSIPLGQDRDGDEVSSAIVRWKGGTSKNVSQRMTRNEEIGLETLRDAITNADGNPVAVDDWRPLFYGKHIGDNDRSKKKSFQRVRESLEKKRFIEVNDAMYSIPADNCRDLISNLLKSGKNK